MEFIVKYFLIAQITLLLISNSVWAKVVLKGSSEGQNFIVEQLTRGHKIPWGMTFINKDEILFTEREGNIKILNIKSKKVRSILGAPKVYARNQGGLLDVNKDPKSDWIYFTYSYKKVTKPSTILARAKLKDNKMIDWTELLVTESESNKSHHFGSRITFQDDYVFFGMGDRGIRKQAQDLTNHAGTIMRLHKNGKVPANNPFLKNKNYKSEIWSFGHRNPQGLVFDKVRNILWEMEHGPRGGDEINIITKATNFGWPIQSYGEEYWGPIHVGSKKSKGTQQPFKFYVPSIAPCGLEVYSGKVFKKWKGDLFSGALKKKHLNRVVVSGNKAVKEERLLKKLNSRIRNVKEGPDGFLYVATDNGKILRIRN